MFESLPGITERSLMYKKRKRYPANRCSVTWLFNSFHYHQQLIPTTQYWMGLPATWFPLETAALFIKLCRADYYYGCLWIISWRWLIECIIHNLELMRKNLVSSSMWSSFFFGPPLKSFSCVCFSSPSLSTSAPQLTHTIHLSVIYSFLTPFLLHSSPPSLLLSTDLVAPPSHPLSPLLTVSVWEAGEKREGCV